MMKRTYISIYAAIALFIILGTVVWFAHGIISESDQGEIDAKKTFAYFAKSAIKLSEKVNFTEKAYKDKLTSLAEESEFKAFVIANLNGKALISWPRNSELIVSDQASAVHIEPDGIFTKVFTGQVQVKTLQGHKKTIVITAAIPTLKGNDIFVLSRSAFLIVLTVVILTLLMILLQSILNSSKKVYVDVPAQSQANIEEYQASTAPYNYEPYSAYPTEESANVENQEPSTAAVPYQSEQYDYATQYEAQESTADYCEPYNQDTQYEQTENASVQNASYTETYSQNYGVVDEKQEKESENRTYTLEDLDDLSITKKYPYEASPDDSTLVSEEPVKPHKVPVSEEANPYEADAEDVDFRVLTGEDEAPTNYSKSTGVRFAGELEESLASELKRAAAAEVDVALIIVKLKDLTLESIVAKRIAEMLYDIVKVRDMIFEYEGDGFASILYDKNLDAAMRESENIYQHIQSILDEYDISEPIAIGLTTRTDRLIDADRMLEEAKAAIVRAIRSADDPIVAFRVNQKKYRDFIAEH